MKRFNSVILLGLGLCQAALGGPSPIYQNFGVVTSPPQVDALTFYNAGIFNIRTFTSLSPTNLQITLLLAGFNDIPFETKDTLNFTNGNSGIMIGVPGFLFDTSLATSRRSASSFMNEGFLQGIDEP